MNVARLGDHAKFLSGFAFKSQLFNDDGIGLPVVRIRDVVRGHSETFYSGEYDDRYIVSRGEYLIGMDGKFNLARWNSVAALLNQRVCKIDSISEDVSRAYLGRFLAVALKEIEDATPFVTVKHLSMKVLNEIRIPLPPLAEQKRIAKILDAADALRAKRRESLAQLDILLQSTFLDMFGDPVTNPMGWGVRNLADVFWLQEGPGVRKWQFKESGVKLLNVANILKSGDLDLSKTDRHVSVDEVQDRYSHFLVDVGDLVIASSGISIDEDDLLRTRGAFVAEEHLPLCMNTSTIRFKATDGVSDLRFLQQWLQSREFRTQITREVTGSAQKNFGPTHLKRLLVTLPPLELQHQFATVVESIDQQKTTQRAHLDELDTLFASLQSRAFRGDL